ncbi:phage major capsid protein [Clostridium frigidicarnis]|uniref:Phage major capsid protein, HK97 family n=1 Tax=Clostridium frigidicarnis TaxID=84698 RepID=A0A1I0V1J8_9CLOT|nr:phage major capsid protein [Clostridium frigidicarnis]SFA70229.1 phage major capsid protein, HK97 family [Clostridium frigidicarnis]
MKTIELRQEIATKTEDLKTKLEARDLEGAKVVKEEIRKSKGLLAIAEEQEREEKRDLENQRNEKGSINQIGKTNEMRALIKKVMGEEMTTEERAIVKTTDNAPVIPKQFLNRLIELQKGFGSLKQYTDIIPVTKNEGTFPLVDLDQNELKDIAEGEDIVDGTLVTRDQNYKCSKVGLKQVLTSELVEDAEVEIESLCTKNFVNITVAKENAKILKIIKENATVVESTKKDYTEINNLIDSSLPSVKNGLSTITNVTGFCYLKNLTDKNGRPLNLVTMIGDKYYFNGKELITVDDALLSPLTEGNKIFYVANIKEAIKFMDRKASTIERWRKPDNDTYNISILERFDVVKGSVRSIKSIEF